MYFSYTAVAATALLLAGFSQLSGAQFVAAPKNLTHKTGYADIPVRYKQVPTGICELDPNVKSYSGYADVGENQHIFWWFFESRNVDPTEAPLTVWINGGPGSSSMIGLFQELGPCYINSTGDVYNNPYSWSNASNMLFIDQPTQVGFSYSVPVPAYTDPTTQVLVQLPGNHCPEYASDWGCGTYSYWNESLTASTTPQAAPNMWKTLQGFMGAFPQYSRHGFYFATESYGGHYGPVFNEYFETQNMKNIAGAHNISLQGVMIGNGWVDPILQYEAYYNYTVFPGNTYNYAPFNQSVQNQMYNNLYGPGNCRDQLIDCRDHGIDEICSAADLWCINEVESLYDLYTGRDEYDMRELTPDPFPPNFYVDYLNRADIQRAIGAYVNYSDFDAAVGTAFGTTGDDSRLVGTLGALKALIAQNVTVLLYTGDADYICNWLGTEAVAEEVNPTGFSSAGYTNISTVDGRVHGQVKQAAKFSHARIFDSGHEVPFYQPVVALALLERTIAGTDIATGKTVVGPGYVSKGTKKSMHINGNSTLQFEIVDPDRTYNTTTNMPNNATESSTHVLKAKGKGKEKVKRKVRNFGI